MNRTGDVEVPDGQANTTLVLDDGTAGVAIEGDVTLDGNHTALYGLGVEDTRITGNLVITGHNVRVRGVTVEGDVIIRGNQAALVLVDVKGNVLVQGDKAVLAEMQVRGTVRGDGDRPTMIHVARE
jgi:hypothetical protein